MPFGRRTTLKAGAAAAGRLAFGALLARPATADAGALEVVLRYHEISKHRPGRSAPAPDRVEWSRQPDPFRRFDGAPLLRLDEVPPSPAPTWDAVARGDVPPRPAEGAAISQLLYDSLALSAWKERGTERWPLRVNPSSGNLHPIEAYVVGGPFPPLTAEPAVLHYAPLEHGVERRTVLEEREWADLAAGLPAHALLAALTSIDWREAWKYGERGYRYCLLDAGHAAAALAIAAAALGWRARLVESWRDADVARLVGADRQSGPEAERAEAMLAIWPGREGWPRERERAFRLPARVGDALATARLEGVPNRLGDDHRRWPAMDAAARAAQRSSPAGGAFWAPPRGRDPAIGVGDGAAARVIVRRRRSALAFDPATAVDGDVLFRMLARILPGANPSLFDALPWRPAVHLALLVHRVDGLRPGLYLLAREPTAAPELEATLGAGRNAWARVEGAPEGLPLRRLSSADLREHARGACCDQEIASDGAFTAAMLTRFEPALREHGAWMYRRLHWEAGVLGHAIYLEAEAAGLGATAMGCFLDDVLHRLLGLSDRRYQVLYTIAVGRPVEDPRLRTIAPYAHRH